MLIDEREQRSDATVLYGILARAALERFDSPPGEGSERDVYFTNLIRLLEMYRYQTLKQIQMQGVLDVRPLGREMLGPEDDKTDLVEQALDSARLAIWPSESKEDVTTLLQSVLKKLRDLGAQSINEPEKLATTRRFLEEFQRQLQVES